jgi:hypothetical protein
MELKFLKRMMDAFSMLGDFPQCPRWFSVFQWCFWNVIRFNFGIRVEKVGRSGAVVFYPRSTIHDPLAPGGRRGSRVLWGACADGCIFGEERGRGTVRSLLLRGRGVPGANPGQQADSGKAAAEEIADLVGGVIE